MKVRGFRVELGEVEMALLAVAGVKEAVCTARPDASGEKSLVAYVVAQDGVELDEPRIKSAVGKSLPPFMMPSRVVFLAALPLSKNGKVDRGALPEPRALGQERAFVAARDERERRLVALWEELLEREPIGVTDDFFDVGGHSLLSLTLLGRCRTDLGLTLSLPRFLEQPTIEGIVRSLGESAAQVQVSRRFYTYNGAGRRPPMVLVGAGHFALLYREFPKLFPADQPVHFVQLSTAEASDARAIVDLVEPEVLAACPSGPVVVGAFDASAHAALTLARRLEARGRDVPLLLMIDPDDGAGTRAPSLPARVLRVGRRLRDLVRDKLDGDGARGEPLRAAANRRLFGPRAGRKRRPRSGREPAARRHRLGRRAPRARRSHELSRPGPASRPSSTRYARASTGSSWRRNHDARGELIAPGFAAGRRARSALAAPFSTSLPAGKSESSVKPDVTIHERARSRPTTAGRSMPSRGSAKTRNDSKSVPAITHGIRIGVAIETRSETLTGPRRQQYHQRSGVMITI